MRKRLTAAAGLLLALTAAAPGADIAIPRPRTFNESITATRRGDLFAGSVGDGSIWHARPGDAAATLWLDGAQTDVPAILGVFADERAGTLWACGRSGQTGTDAEKDRASALLAFDLRTRARKGRWQVPNGARATCNDVAVAADGTLYAAETSGGRILRLRPGAAALEVWMEDPRLGGIDGIAMDRDGTLYVSTISTSRVFRVGMRRDGAAGALTEIAPSRKIDRPDAMRYLAPGRFLFGENSPGGGIVEARVAGDRMEVRTLAGGRPGTTSAVAHGGRVYGVVAKLNYRSPAMAGQDPGPFAIYSVPLR